MPAEGFLQRFHDLAEVDAEVRLKAAVEVRKDLQSRSQQDRAADLEYAFRRLVRGVQSSRQCCRQGFSLALAEILSAFPGELQGVLDLIRQNTELQPGLKNSELKDRLLGRLFAYAAVMQAGCLKVGISARPAKRADHGALAELGKGLHEVFAMRPYLKAPAARMLADAATELVAGGLAGKVPELLEPWSLEDKVNAMTGAGATLEVHTAGLLLELRALYVQAEQAAASKETLSRWPACVRMDVLAKPTSAEGLAQAVGTDLVAASMSDGLSWVVGPFCTWLLQATKQKGGVDFQNRVWPALHSVLFPEKSSPAAEAQGLRALSEIASRLHDAGMAEAAGANRKPKAAAALVQGLFDQMPRGLALLFRALSWQRAQSHPAAVFAQLRLVEAVGEPVPVPQQGNKKKGKATADKAPPAVLPMTDDTRLAILAAVQGQKSFGTMNGKYQRMWQHALLAPLSSAGVRTRCTTLLASLNSGVAGFELAKKRLYADQLVQLAQHSQAPDEVILSTLCLLFTEAYFEPTAGAETKVTFSLNKFRSSLGLDISASEDDLVMSTLNASASTNGAGEDDKGDISDATHRTQWRLKLWSALVNLSKHMSPEQAAKMTATTTAADGEEPVMRTYAYHGCLSDGSLWVMRLHEWWDYIVGDPEGSPKLSPKKKRKMESGGKMRCAVALTSEDTSLRRRCLERCRAILSEPEGAVESMPMKQRNALCGLPLVLALSLLGKDDEKDADDEAHEMQKEKLQVLVQSLEEFPLFSELPKQKDKAKKDRADVCANVGILAAQIFVESSRLVKEAAKSAWRELSDFVDDDSVMALVASVRDVDVAQEHEKDDNKDGDDEESEEEDDESGEDGEEVSAANQAKIARLQKMTADLAAKRAAESAAGEEVENEDGDVNIDGAALMDMLADDGGDNGGLLASFASSGLNDKGDATPKMSKWQLRLRDREEELTRKFREVDLIEQFTTRNADKRQIMPQLLQELFDAILAAGRRAMGKDGKAKEGEEANGANPKKKTNRMASLQRMEKELVQRLAGVLFKCLKHVCRGPNVLAACKWHTTAEWAERAQALAATGSSPQTSAAGQRPAEVGSVLLYWLCCLHRQRAALDTGTEPLAWTFAIKLLKGGLEDWGTKKGSDRWCQALLGAFATRVPQALLRLPWAEHVRTSRNMFVQREQVVFITDKILRPLEKDSEGATEFSASVAILCSDILESTLTAASGGEGASASQRQKMRRELLRCLAVIFRLKKQKNDRQHCLTEEASRQICKVIVKVRDAQAARKGEVFQLCLHLHRSLRGEDPRSRSKSPNKKDSPRLKHARDPEEVNSGGEGPPSKKSKRVKTGGGESKKFFGAM